MTFETLSLIRWLLVNNKQDAEVKVKALGREFAEFRKSHPWADEGDFVKAEEMADYKEALNIATRALKEFDSVKWQGVA